MATMENPACQVIYVHRKVGQGQLIRSTLDPSLDEHTNHLIRDEVAPLLEAFGEVHVCSTGVACLDKLVELHDRPMLDMIPTIVLLDTPYDDYIEEENRVSIRSQSPTADSPSSSTAEIHAPDEDLYGLNLLRKLVTETRLRNIAKLVVPIPVVSHSTTGAGTNERIAVGAPGEKAPSSNGLPINRGIIRKCLDLGAVDVIISPLSNRCIASLEICAYRAHRDFAREQASLIAIKRGRQRSWVGINEEKPFAYLREAMVSNLMKGICRLGPEDELVTGAHVAVSTQRQAEVAAAVGEWHFSAHLYNDDELVVAAMVMFRHALSMPELEKWRIPAEQLIGFLVACRAAYNSFVPYHNFRHVVDVLQATFSFLVHIGAIGPYPATSKYPTDKSARSPMAALVGPFEALTLLITAIGHDVGHPGVNNGFLVTLNAPLAQLYNDRSVLESFHCAAYSQILRRYWPAAFEDSKMRSLMISSILATDMGLHFDYMKKMGDVQEKLQENNTTDGWNGRQIEEQKAVACSLLIKCADISNVARRHDAAVQWMHILSEEFSRQASMESELQIPSSLMAPPKQDLASLAKAQLSFMNLFAIPLFQGVADLMPAMRYTVDELELNKILFEAKVEDEKKKSLRNDDPVRRRLLKEGTFSPRTMSYAVGMEEDDSSALKSQKPELKAVHAPGTTGVIPASLVDGEVRDEEALDPQPRQPIMKPTRIPNTNEEYKEVNGKVSTVEEGKPILNMDPFNTSGQAASITESVTPVQRRQRCSETTEGSASGGLAGDWVSQATSTATGKMPMSPSTKGTSIVSKDSIERPNSAPGFETTDRLAPGQPMSKNISASDQSTPLSTGSLGKADGKSLRKKSSRFRMRDFKDFPFFRRHKTASPPCPTTNSVG